MLQLSRPLQNASIFLENYLGQRVLEMHHVNDDVVELLRHQLISGQYHLRVVEEDQVIATKTMLICD